MIVVCEPICHGHEHVPFNGAMLETICAAYPSKKVLFCGEISHLQQVRRQIPHRLSSAIHWQSIELSPRHTKLLTRSLADFQLVAHLLNIAETSGSTHIVFTCIVPPILFALKLFLKIRNKSVRVQIVLHGILSSLIGWRSRNLFIRFTDLKSTLTFGANKRIQYIILEESIKTKLLSIIPSLQENVAVLEHPIESINDYHTSISYNQPIRFGFLGVATEAKGFDRYLNVASKIKKKFPGQTEFHAYGPISYRASAFEMSILDVQPQQKSLTRERYIDGIKSLHYTCFPYKKNHYELSPSGALLDAVAFSKPLIASNLPIFKGLFSKYGDVGYLFDDEGDFCAIINDILKKADDKHYINQVLKLQKARDERLPSFLAIRYRNITSGFFS